MFYSSDTYNSHLKKNYYGMKIWATTTATTKNTIYKKIVRINKVEKSAF